MRARTFQRDHHDTAMRADGYLAGADALQSWALQHRVVRTIEGEAVPFAPVEYVILRAPTRRGVDLRGSEGRE